MLTDPLRFDTPVDVVQKVSQTLIKYKNKFHFAVKNDHDDLGIDITDLPTGIKHSHYLYEKGYFPETHRKNIHSSDTDLDYKTPELGYLNLPTHVSYISRVPNQQYQRSLSENNLVASGIGTHRVSRAYILSDSFYNMLTHVYPNVDECIHALQTESDTFLSKACNNRFALAIDNLKMIYVYHLQKPLGFIQPHDKHNTLIIPNPQHQNPYFEKKLKELGFHTVTG